MRTEQTERQKRLKKWMNAFFIFVFSGVIFYVFGVPWIVLWALQSDRAAQWSTDGPVL